MKNEIIVDSPLLDIYPESWRQTLGVGQNKLKVLQYRNLQHFKNHVSVLTQKEDDKCGVTYAVALKEMRKNVPVITAGNYEIIKNKVKQSLIKRSLISDTVYEGYEYTANGTGVIDVAKYLAQDPECILTPKKAYTNYFYELYISISYNYTVPNSTITNNMAKILATIELLEKEHYYCKITLIFPDKDVTYSDDDKRNLLILIPLFSHRDHKSIETMSAVLNDRLLRKFCFAILEDTYKSNLSSGYGTPVHLEQTINVGYEIDEIDLAEQILSKVITPCQTR